jgi:nicotinic acid phosphoribosyltransferase
MEHALDYLTARLTPAERQAFREWQAEVMNSKSFVESLDKVLPHTDERDEGLVSALTDAAYASAMLRLCFASNCQH